MHPLEHVGPHGTECFGQPTRINEADAGRHRQALQRRNGGIFAIPVTDHQRADLVANLPISHTVPELDHGAGAFETGDVRRAGRHRIAPHTLQAIGAVDPSGGEPDQDLTWFWFGDRAGRRHQHLGSAGRLDFDHGLGRGDVGEHRSPLIRGAPSLL